MSIVFIVIPFVFSSCLFVALGPSPAVATGFLFPPEADLLQGLLASRSSRQECVTRRFYNPLSITIPGALVSPGVRAARNGPEENLDRRGMHARPSKCRPDLSRRVCPPCLSPPSNRPLSLYPSSGRARIPSFSTLFAYAATSRRDLFDVGLPGE